MEDRLCPECSRHYQGRTDKKFCSDACRNSFNNKQNADQINYMRIINNALRKNRRILENLNPDGKVKTHRDKLLSKGFNFEFFTIGVGIDPGAQHFVNSLRFHHVAESVRQEVGSAEADREGRKRKDFAEGFHDSLDGLVWVETGSRYS